MRGHVLQAGAAQILAVDLGCLRHEQAMGGLQDPARPSFVPLYVHLTQRVPEFCVFFAFIQYTEKAC